MLKLSDLEIKNFYNLMANKECKELCHQIVSGGANFNPFRLSLESAVYEVSEFVNYANENLIIVEVWFWYFGMKFELVMVIYKGNIWRMRHYDFCLNYSFLNSLGHCYDLERLASTIYNCKGIYEGRGKIMANLVGKDFYKNILLEGSNFKQIEEVFLEFYKLCESKNK